MTPEQETEEQRKRRLLGLGSTETIVDPLDQISSVQMPRMTPGLRLMPRAQSSQPLGLNATTGQASPQYFLRSNDILAPSRQGPVQFDYDRYRQMRSHEAPSIDEEEGVSELAPGVPDIAFHEGQRPAIRSFADRENDALSMVDSAMPGLRLQQEQLTTRRPSLEIPSLRIAEPSQAPLSNEMSYEEQALARLAPNIVNGVQQVTSDTMRRAEAMRRPWTLGRMEVTPQIPSYEDRVLRDFTNNAAQAGGDFAGRFAQRIQDMRRPWTMGRMEVVPSVSTHEEQVLNDFADNASRAGGEFAGQFAQRVQDMRRPWALGRMEVVPRTRTHEEEVLGDFANNAANVGRQETAALQRRLQSVPEIGPIEFTPGQEQTLAQADTSPKEDTPFFELPKIVIKTQIPEPPKPPDTSSPARYETPQQPTSENVPRETQTPENVAMPDQVPVAQNSAQAPDIASQASNSPWEQELNDARRRRRNLNIIRGVLGGVGGLVGIIGAARDNPFVGGLGAGLAGGALRGINPNRPVNDFLQDRQIAQDEQDRGYLAQDRETAAQDRAFNQRLTEQESNANTAYRQAIARSMESSAGYRQHLAERDAALHDPNSPLAAAQRDVVRRLILSMPPSLQASYGGLDLRGLSSAQLKETADEILRRASMLYRRDRRIDLRGIRGAVYQLNLLQQAGMSPDDVDPAVLQQILGGRIRGPGGGGGGRRSAQPTIEERFGAAPAQIIGESGQPLPNRSLAQLEADYDAHIRGQVVPGRSNPLEMSQAEMRLAYEISQNKRHPAYEAANRLLGHGTRSQEHDAYRTRFGTAFTAQDYERARGLLAGPVSNILRANDLLRSLEGITQAQFSAAVSRQPGVPTAFGRRVESLTAQMAEHANRILRSRAGQAVTSQEERRILEEMAAGRLNSIDAYRDALRRSIRNTQADVQSLGYDERFLRQYARRVRGAQ